MLGIHNLLIINCDYGRLGNRLHTHINALAWCIENNYNLINLSFSEYAELFESCPKHRYGNFYQTKHFIFKTLAIRTLRNFLRKMLLSEKWLLRLSLLINQVTPSSSGLLQESDLSRQINQKKINLIKDWDICCSNSMKIHQHKLRNFLSPNKKFVVSAGNLIDNLKSKYDCVIGVHARRGDYETYLDGMHYHSWESYLNWINETRTAVVHAGKSNIGFIICSDEVPPPFIVENQTIHVTSENEMMIDIHSLSLCDYNIGPPSSFGTWASWYGKVPRLVVNHNTKITSLDQFEVSSSC